MLAWVLTVVLCKDPIHCDMKSFGPYQSQQACQVQVGNFERMGNETAKCEQDYLLHPERLHKWQ